MELTLADQYYLKAFDYYPYNMEFAIENLNYALSHDDEHASSNCLLGRIFMYQLKDYNKARECFYKSLKGDIHFPDTYKYYSLLRIWQGEYDRAMTIIDRGLRVTGMDRPVLLTHKSIIYEWRGEFKKAKAVLETAKLFTIEKTRIDQINMDLSRIKEKMKVHKAQKKRGLKRLAAI